MSIEKFVGFVLTPIIAAASGWLSATVGQLIPGVTLNSTDLTALGVAGATAGLAGALKWLHGQQKFVKFETDAEKVEAWVKKAVASNVVVAPALSDIERSLDAHKDEIVKSLGDKLQVPPSVEEVADQVVDNLSNALKGSKQSLTLVPDAADLSPDVVAEAPVAPVPETPQPEVIPPIATQPPAPVDPTPAA